MIVRNKYYLLPNMLCTSFTDFCGKSEVVLHPDNVTRLHSLPRYPYNYPHSNLTCVWYLQGTRDGYIVVTFINFSLHFLTSLLSFGLGHNISEESTVLSFGGNKGINTLTLNSSSAWVTFSTGDDSSWGFDIDVQLRDDFGKSNTGLHTY